MNREQFMLPKVMPELKVKTGVCIVTSGPGATNVVTGLADAMIDSIPIVCISGQVASPLLGSECIPGRQT